jgi:hypothetical protein
MTGGLAHMASLSRPKASVSQIPAASLLIVLKVAGANANASPGPAMDGGLCCACELTDLDPGYGAGGDSHRADGSFSCSVRSRRASSRRENCRASAARM